MKDNEPRYKKGDIITFLSNQPGIHLLEMFGTGKFNPDETEEPVHGFQCGQGMECANGCLMDIRNHTRVPGFLYFIRVELPRAEHLQKMNAGLV